MRNCSKSLTERATILTSNPTTCLHSRPGHLSLRKEKGKRSTEYEKPIHWERDLNQSRNLYMVGFYGIFLLHRCYLFTAYFLSSTYLANANKFSWIFLSMHLWFQEGGCSCRCGWRRRRRGGSRHEALGRRGCHRSSEWKGKNKDEDQEKIKCSRSSLLYVCTVLFICLVKYILLQRVKRPTPRFAFSTAEIPLFGCVYP